MNTLKQRLLNNWHIMRVFRLGIGILLLVLGIQNKDWAMSLFSTFFLYQAITDTGCCGQQGCYTSQSRKPESDLINEKETIIEYEEVK